MSCMWIPQALAGDHCVILPPAPNVDEAHWLVTGQGDSLNQAPVLALSLETPLASKWLSLQ